MTTKAYGDAQHAAEAAVVLLRCGELGAPIAQLKNLKTSPEFLAKFRPEA